MGSHFVFCCLDTFYCLSNRPQVTMVYRLKTTQDVGRTQEEFVNHKPQASDLRNQFFECSSNITIGLSAYKP